MFRAFSKSVYYLHGAILCLAMIPNLPNFKGLIESYGIDMEEFEAIASGSNAGALMVVLRLENCFLFLMGVLLLIVAYHVSVEQRAMPSLAISACLFFTAYEEYQISTNSWQGINVFQGQFTEVLRNAAAPVNGGFGLLHALVSIGTFLGLAKEVGGSKGSAKRD